MSRRDRRTARIVLGALAAGAVLAANGTMVYLGGSYASYSDTRTIPLINITVAAHLRTTTPSSTPPPVTPATTKSTPVHRAGTQPQTPAPQQNQPPTDTPTTAPAASDPATQPPAPTTTESDSE